MVSGTIKPSRTRFSSKPLLRLRNPPSEGRPSSKPLGALLLVVSAPRRVLALSGYVLFFAHMHACARFSWWSCSSRCSSPRLTLYPPVVDLRSRQHRRDHSTATLLLSRPLVVRGGSVRRRGVPPRGSLRRLLRRRHSEHPPPWAHLARLAIRAPSGRQATTAPSVRRRRRPPSELLLIPALPRRPSVGGGLERRRVAWLRAPL